jgi:hypothetical protein
VKTLGWAVLRWITRFLPSPADASRPFVLTDPQARFVLGWYALDDAGRFVYRRGLVEEVKGWGKSPLGSALALAEFAGPVRFAGWGEDGEPVGRPWGTAGDPPPWVQIGACSEDQAVSNVYSLIWSMLAENEARAARALGIDLGRTRLFLKAQPGAKLEAVTSAWGAREGQRLTFGLLDETHNWLKSNGGHRLARVLGRNAAKMGGRTLELANAPEVGEDSVAERTEATYAAGAAGVLFSAVRPSREPDPDMSDAELAQLLAEVYGDSAWVDQDRLLREVRDPGVPWSEIARFYFNVPGAGTLAAVDPGLWDSRQASRELGEGEKIALGFDGSHSQDGTALVGATRDGWLFPVEILERPAGVDDWRVDRSRIHRALEHMFATYDVAYLYADPWKWQDELQEWAERWPDRIVEFPTNSTTRMAPAVDRFRSALQEGRISHDGDDDLRRHVVNARLRKVGRDEDGRGRYILEKAGPGRLIDAAVASVLANEARAQIAPASTPMIAIGGTVIALPPEPARS